MTYKTVDNNEGSHVVLDGVEIAIKPDRASALDFIAGHATQRAESAEARADTCAEMIETLVNEKAQAEADAADLLKVYREQKETIKTIEAERDEARRQLSEAQRAIDVLSNTVVAQNNEIKRLRQKREDVEQYRAEIARLNQAATA